MIQLEPSLNMQPLRKIIKHSACLAFVFLVASFRLSEAKTISPDVAGVIVSYANNTNNFNDGQIVPDAGFGKSPRIVGGSAASITNFPYQLSLRHRGRHMCGASVLNTNYALTAAHCLAGMRASDFKVYAGSADRLSGGVLHDVAAIGYHANYDRNTLMNDIAYVKVRTPFRFSDKIQPIGLPTKKLISGTMVTTSGWGLTQGKASSSLPRMLLSATLKLIDFQQCADLTKVSYGMVCAIIPGKGACSGDSGGPLVYNGIQYGVVSWGRFDSNGNCMTTHPSIYADVYVYKDWIMRYTS